MISLTTDKAMLGYELLGTYSNISHFVTTRKGGCGIGTYGSFNCSPFTGDNPIHIYKNQQKLLDSLEKRCSRLIIPKQVHGTETCVIDESFFFLPEDIQTKKLDGMDAVITNVPGCCVCVSTADCVPLLIYDPVQQVVAAVHAGWRGTVARIVEKVIIKLQEHFHSDPSTIMACIGPSISVDAFEVGDEVVEEFEKNGFDMRAISFRNTMKGKSHIDLWEANRLQLLNSGIPVSQIECAGLCTYTLHEQFFSARRLGINSGRILSGIMIK